MEITAELKDTWKEEKVNLRNGISMLEKNMSDFKVERKSEWKSFKSKFKGDINHLEKSLKDLKSNHKKRK